MTEKKTMTINVDTSDGASCDVTVDAREDHVSPREYGRSVAQVILDQLRRIPLKEDLATTLRNTIDLFEGQLDVYREALKELEQ